MEGQVATEVKQDSVLLTELRAVRDNNRFWKTEEELQMAHSIIPVPATEAAVVKDGKLLLQYRTFKEWPKPYDKAGWYIPGGYVPWKADLAGSCLSHIRKDLNGEYNRVGIENFNFDAIKLSAPVVIGTKKWMPGEHPFGCPVSLVCVCELLAGEIIETDWLKWSSETIPTDVPHHQSFQDLVLAWLNASPEFKAEHARLMKLIA